MPPMRPSPERAARSFDFRDQQRRSRRATVALVAAFTAMIVAIGVMVGLIAAALLAAQEGMDAYWTDRFDPAVFGAVSVAVVALIALTSLLRMVTLGGDGAKIAKSLGGTEITEETANPYHRRYLNVVEEMAIASGLPRPRAFVIKHEQGINAFAAGSSPDRAAIGMTHGALARLDREELAGVVAHEMAHIANADTRLNTRLLAMVFGLVALYTIGRIALRSFALRGGRRSGNDNNGGGMVVVVAVSAALMLLGALGVLGGRILQAMVSRRREYLADATAVQFTRNPTGIANALKKIGAAAAGGRVANGHAEEARHMFFASLNTPLLGLLSTHPPLVSRIRALDPAFNPERDPVWNADEKSLLREARAEFAGPWG